MLGRIRSQQLGDTEVQQAWLAIAPYQHVVRLQIAMHHQMRMRCLYAIADLGEQRHAEIVRLEQVAKVRQCGGIGHSLTTQVDAAELAEQGLDTRID